MNSSGRFTPKAVIDHLICSNIAPPETKHLNNFLQRFKNKKFGSSKITLGELAAWCEENSALPSPELLDEPFVVDFDSFFPEEINSETDNYESGDSFRFFISTRRLLEFSGNSKVTYFHYFQN